MSNATDDSLQLSEEQINILLSAREIRENDGSPRVVDDRDLEQIRSVMAEALAETTGLPSPESLTIAQMADQLEADESAAVESLTQRPETSRPGADELDETDDTDDGETDPLAALEAADSETRATVRRDVAKAQAISNRLPGRSDVLRRSALERLGLDPADEDALAALEAEIAADPRVEI